jgi:trehalose 6-phosphate synthase
MFENTPGKISLWFDFCCMLTHYSAWWGESFVNELRRISETGDRKVQYGSRPVTGAGPTDKATEGTANGTSIKQEEEDTRPTKDKESDPAAAAEATSDPVEQDLPLQPKKSATQ